MALASACILGCSGLQWRGGGEDAIGGEGGDGTSDAFLGISLISPLTSAGRGAQIDFQAAVFGGRVGDKGECTMGQNQIVLEHLTVQCALSRARE